TDGYSDLVWQNDSTRDIVVWYMGGTQGNTYLGSNWLGKAAGWRVVGTADFNNDGHPDLIWQNDTSRDVVSWYMCGSQGNQYCGGNWFGAAQGWKVIAR